MPTEVINPTEQEYKGTHATMVSPVSPMNDVLPIVTGRLQGLYNSYGLVISWW